MLEIIKYPSRGEWGRLLARASLSGEDVTGIVENVIRGVRERGDRALLDFAREFDGAELASLRVTRDEKDVAEAMVGERLKEALLVSRRNIEAFHKAQRSCEVRVETMPGVVCRQRAVPIESVGLYVPGGSAPLVSTVLMLAVPARLAGCRRVVMCTPCDRSGRVAPEVLCAAGICGVDEIFKVGGAQAIAAMAYGTESVPAVDKIFGPGNRFVTRAKQLVGMDAVAIDMPAGPSEVMVLADDSARAAFVAADMLSQAEHGADSQAVLVTDSLPLAVEVAACVERQLERLPRKDIARKALAGSRIIVVDGRREMTDMANEYAAEHLIVSMRSPWDVASEITAAGSVFIGNYSPESAGDYSSGTNHTLPTAGWARSCGGINMDSFVRKITYQELSREGLEALSEHVIALAGAEGLDAHANAVKIRLEDGKN